MTDTGASAWSRPCVCDVDTRSCLRHNRVHEIPPSRILAISLYFECVYFAACALSTGDEHTSGFGHACGLSQPDRFTHSGGDRHSHCDAATYADVHAHAAAR